MCTSERDHTPAFSMCFHIFLHHCVCSLSSVILCFLPSLSVAVFVLRVLIERHKKQCVYKEIQQSPLKLELNFKTKWFKVKRRSLVWILKFAVFFLFFSAKFLKVASNSPTGFSGISLQQIVQKTWVTLHFLIIFFQGGWISCNLYYHERWG